ncbi:uncharacterized protein LOC113380719 [Ctenocephalides felis]|uniref:uncharacterized protein LOC113380719 n=1 Tax=Ctenocephalides felis TaxID=7515 RepID=UPI000E6E4C8B|nr:uncharacterized protein LOC113380719 [Ctenocephalides felis]
MSSGYLVNVPKLKGRETYDDWAFAAENFLILEDLAECIVEPKHEAEIDVIKDKKARAKLILTLDTSLYVYVKETKTSAQLWSKLKAMYSDSGFTRRINLLRTLISTRLINCESTSSYVNQIIETGQRLRGTGFNIDDEWIGSLLLAGLPEKFSPMIMAIEYSGIAITTDTIKTKLLDIGNDVAVNNDESAFVAKQNGRVFSTGSYNKTDWYVDSGASIHLVNDNNNLREYNKKPDVQEVRTANNMQLKVVSCGSVSLRTAVYGQVYDVEVQDAHYVPQLSANLLSVSALTRKGNRVVFNDNKCKIYSKNNTLVAVAVLTGGVYKLMINNINCLLVTDPKSGNLWHRRLGHINKTDLCKLSKGLVKGLTISEKATSDINNCIVCCEGKQTRLPFKHKGSRAVKVLELVQSDVCGPMEQLSIGGSRYFLSFQDDYSKMCFVYFLKSKDEVLRCFKEFRAVEYLKENGIIHQRTNPYTPEQNGIAERLNRTLVEKARCLIFDGQLDKKFWAEAVNTAAYLKNRSVTSDLTKTPFELWWKKKPDVSHIKIFGSVVMDHVPKQKRSKWDRKSVRKILIGYADDVKGYRLFDPVTNKISTSRNVVIMETIDDEPSKNPIEPVENSVSVGVNEMQPVTEEKDQNAGSDHEQNIIEIRKSERTRKKKTFDDYVTYACNNFPMEEPKTIKEAMSRPDKQYWMDAIAEELKSFEENKAWELVNMPENCSIVDCKWVFKRKVDTENQVRYRARLVARGFTQQYGVDYDETFSPVVRHSTLRLLMALSVRLGLSITHLDVTTAFLNGHLKELVYMKKPDGYRDNSSKVLKLNKAVYGLKQSSRVWYQKVETVLLGLGYRKSKYEPCMFIKGNNNTMTVIALYVDDFFVFSNDIAENSKLKTELNLKFKIKDLGKAKCCLGIRINYEKDGSIILDQERYIDQLLNKFNMQDCKQAGTPMESDLKLSSGKIEQELPYQQLIGSLMYLAVMTRPDIAYSLSYLSQFNNCYVSSHFKSAKRVLKYLQGTKKYGLKFKKDSENLVGYTDADWASDNVDRKSYTGFCFKFSNSIISWESSKQKTVALSSTEAEYMAISDASKEAIYLKNLLMELTDVNESVRIYNDNKSAQKLSYNPVFHKRSKHIDVRHHFIREAIADGVIDLKYMQTNDMPADIFTKSLSVHKHLKFLKQLGMSTQVV